jgi:AcrR family transcriptional regulator
LTGAPTRAARKTAQAQSPWLSASGRAEQRELKRQAVLQTAAQLFNEQGFHQTSLDDIADRLNVTKPTLYYYVDSKVDILMACVRTALELMRDEITRVRNAGGQPLDQLTACMRAYANIVMQDFGKCVIRIGEEPLPEKSRKELRRLKAGIDREFRKLIESCIAEGTIAACNPKLAAFMLAGALSWIGRWYRADGDMQPEEITEEGIHLLLHGVLGKVQEPARKRAQRTPKGD